MTRMLAALALACALAILLASPATAAPRHKHRPACIPVTVEGVGTVRVCPGR